MHSSIICIDDFVNNIGGFTMCISNDLTIYSFGNSTCSAHGHLDEQINIPTQIKGLTNIKNISCGLYHTICLDYNHNVYTFGSNRDGQLGIGKDYHELEQIHIPHKVNLPPIIQISCGYYFCACLSEDGDLCSFGDNFDGQLGLGDITRCTSPQQIDIKNIKFIECGASHVICKNNNNEYYSWGFNESGQLGQGNNESCNKPIQCLNWPDNIISIKSGVDHTLLLTNTGYIYSFGHNENGQLGLNDENIKFENIPTLIKDIPEIQRIECGFDCSLCVDIDNYLWFFGDNANAQFGLDDEKDRFKPSKHPTLSNIIDISSKGSHTFVKTINNKIYAFGWNDNSQLGRKTLKDNQKTPIQVLKDKEDIWCSLITKNKQKSARK